MGIQAKVKGKIANSFNSAVEGGVQKAKGKAITGEVACRYCCGCPTDGQGASDRGRKNIVSTKIFSENK